jgi:hypothetical protein
MFTVTLSRHDSAIRNHSSKHERTQMLGDQSVAHGSLCRFSARASTTPARRRNFFKASLALSLGLALALAVQHASALFIVNQPWARPAQRGQATEVYMDLTSTDGAALVGVTSDAAGTVTIRAPGKTSGKTNRVALPAQTVVALAPGGNRIALTGLKQPLKLGDRVKLTLTIEAADGSRQNIGVDAEVRHRSPLDDERRAHQHTH